MGIKFDCVHCGHVLHVKDYLAGKRGVCPHCQGKVVIPATSSHGAASANGAGVAVEVPILSDAQQPTRELNEQAVIDHRMVISLTDPATGSGASARQPLAGAPGDPIAEAPQLNWYVLPAGSTTKYGPAPGTMMRDWIAEGRVAADALLWREGWDQWRPAAAIFPQLVAAAAAHANAAVVAVAVQQPVGGQRAQATPSTAPAAEVVIADFPVAVARAAASPASVAKSRPETSPGSERIPNVAHAAGAQASLAIQPVAAVPLTTSPAEASVTDGSQAVVLGLDDVAPSLSAPRAPVQRKAGKITLKQRNLIVGIMAVVVLLMFFVVVYMLWQ